MKKLNNNISLTESFKKLQEQKQEIYTPDKQYIVTYIDTDGQTQNVNYTPETEMNIVEIISKFKEENENFFKLYSIDENLKTAYSSLINQIGDVYTAGSVAHQIYNAYQLDKLKESLSKELKVKNNKIYALYFCCAELEK